MREPRPHREARSSGEAADELLAEARAGRLDGDAVVAVLRASGHELARRLERPAGLTPREVEILGLLARGLLNKQIAARLAITPQTVKKHVENTYAKIGVSSRAAAGLFATEHGLLGVDESARTRARRGSGADIGPALTPVRAASRVIGEQVDATLKLSVGSACVGVWRTLSSSSRLWSGTNCAPVRGRIAPRSVS